MQGDACNFITKREKVSPMIQNAYVCFFDVLGFTSRFLSGGLFNRYDQLIGVLKSIKNQDLKIFLMSDSIVIISEEFKEFKKVARELYTWGILNDFWLRGGITRGSVIKYHQRTIFEENRFILPFLGEGYLRAYALETTLNISGIIVDDIFFTSENENPGFEHKIDYIEYEEYLPKRGYEGKKKVLLPNEHSLRQVVDTMYFKETLKSHAEDVDKFINTFCFYIRYLVEHVDTEDLIAFIERLMDEFELQGRRTLIPTKVVMIFIALIEGLLERFSLEGSSGYSDPHQLELLVSKVISGLKEQGYLAAFVDVLVDFDKRRHTSMFRKINSLRSTVQA